MATSKRVVSVSVKRSKRDRAQKIPTVNPRLERLADDTEHLERLAYEDAMPDRTVTDGIGVIRLDQALLDMLRGYVDTIRKVYPDVWDVPTWDAPWECIPPGIPGLETALLRDVKVAAEFCHAIGGIAGAAAMMDLTPCMLIDNLRL